MQELKQLKKGYISLKKQYLAYVNLIQKDINNPKIPQMRKELIEQLDHNQAQIKKLEEKLL